MVVTEGERLSEAVLAPHRTGSAGGSRAEPHGGPGGTVYVGTPEGLEAYSVLDPSAPKLVGSSRASSRAWEKRSWRTVSPWLRALYMGCNHRYSRSRTKR